MRKREEIFSRKLHTNTRIKRLEEKKLLFCHFLQRTHKPTKHIVPVSMLSGENSLPSMYSVLNFALEKCFKRRELSRVFEIVY